MKYFLYFLIYFGEIGLIYSQESQQIFSEQTWKYISDVTSNRTPTETKLLTDALINNNNDELLERYLNSFVKRADKYDDILDEVRRIEAKGFNARTVILNKTQSFKITSPESKVRFYRCAVAITTFFAAREFVQGFMGAYVPVEYTEARQEMKISYEKLMPPLAVGLTGMCLNDFYANKESFTTFLSEMRQYRKSKTFMTDLRVALKEELKPLSTVAKDLNEKKILINEVLPKVWEEYGRYKNHMTTKEKIMGYFKREKFEKRMEETLKDLSPKQRRVVFNNTNAAVKMDVSKSLEESYFTLEQDMKVLITDMRRVNPNYPKYEKIKAAIEEMLNIQNKEANASQNAKKPSSNTKACYAGMTAGLILTSYVNTLGTQENILDFEYEKNLREHFWKDYYYVLPLLFAPCIWNLNKAAGMLTKILEQKINQKMRFNFSDEDWKQIKKILVSLNDDRIKDVSPVLYQSGDNLESLLEKYYLNGKTSLEDIKVSPTPRLKCLKFKFESLLK